MSAYLPDGLPAPGPAPDGLGDEFWHALREERLLLQRCRACDRFQWGPEWICHRCHAFDLGYDAVEPQGVLYSHERVWHPVHPALAGRGPFIVALVALPQADDVRLVGNLLGDPMQPLEIGTRVEGVFEHHGEGEDGFSLLQWRVST
jgi:uncharacterized OB-fold protein